MSTRATEGRTGTTAIIIFVLGLWCLFVAFLLMGIGVSMEGLTLSVRNASRQAAERMTPEELARVFEMPPTVEDHKEWVGKYFGLIHANNGLSAHAIVGLMVAGTGIALLLLGLSEWLSRRSLLRSNAAGDKS